MKSDERERESDARGLEVPAFENSVSRCLHQLEPSSSSASGYLNYNITDFADWRAALQFEVMSNIQ